MFCVLEGIADRVIEMIEGAARELVLGNPTELTTDVGPVIDQEALDNLQNHLQRLRSTSKVLVAHKERAPTAINLIARSLSDLGSVGCKSTAAVHFSPSF